MRFLLPIYVLSTSSLNSPRPPVSVDTEKRKMLLFSFHQLCPYPYASEGKQYNSYYVPFSHNIIVYTYYVNKSNYFLFKFPHENEGILALDLFPSHNPMIVPNFLRKVN
jgi:hypothetical protein